VKLISIVGARPQFIKLAPLVRQIDNYNAAGGHHAIEHRILHTGQHYDHEMSDVFFDELDLPVPDYRLPSCPGSHAKQTAAMLTGVEQVLALEEPDLVVVYGDTNSTLAGTFAATKLHLPVAHVEAGLRSFNRRMPEEINRIAADHASDLLLAPTATAIENLTREGLFARSVLTGDLMYDSVLHYSALAQRSSSILTRMGLVSGQYALATLHRADNTDNRNRLGALLTALNDIAAAGTTVLLPIHPRTTSRLRTLLPEWEAHPQLRLIAPTGYLGMLALLANARVALTDSGGLQKEAFFLGCPCITLRAETEWIETVDAGANILVDVDASRIRAAIAYWYDRSPLGHADFSQSARAAFGHGDAAARILAAILELLERPHTAEATHRTHLNRARV